MRLLLDECTPVRFARELPGHEVDHVASLGWAGTKNGRLVALMDQAGYRGLLTTDRNLAFQQAVPSASVFVLVLLARSNRIADLKPLAPEVLRALEFAGPGQVLRVGA